MGSTLPAKSTARTAKVCESSASAVRVLGVIQAVNGPASMLHSKVAVESGLLNVKVGVLSLLGSVGLLSIVVSGAVVSTVNVLVFELTLVLPAASVAVALAV